MKIFSRAIHLVWLIALAVFSFASSVPASGFSSAPGLFAYDGQNQVTMVYDGGFPAVFDYDSAAVLRPGEEANPTSGASSLFGKIASFLAAEGTMAVSPYRVTTAGESFIRYESGAAEFSRVTGEGGLIPSTYAAPASEGLLPQSSLNAQYNLWSPEIPRVNAFQVTPPAGTPIIGPRPVMGGLGNEVVFPMGVPPGSVGPVIPVPPH